MRLKLSLQKDSQHSELVSCVGWASGSELYSVGDDHQILRWDFQSGGTAPVVSLPKETFATDIHWLPVGATGSKKQSNQSDLFVLACTDGKFLLVSRLGRVEKSVEAHKGATLGARWSQDGTTLLTFGEDGVVKVWSRSGMLRTLLAQSGSPVYCACWSPDANHVLYGRGKTLIVRPLQPGLKPTQWRAHDGLVLALDWSPAHGLIVSGGEDRKYKVWDSYGRSLYSSFLHSSPISSLAWSPDGELFAVGAFNTLRLCDKTGWSHSLDKPHTGTVLRLAWASDGTQFAGAGGCGQVVFAQVVDRRLEWGHLEATVKQDGCIDVRDVCNDARECLEFSDRIVRASLSWGHLVVATTVQCFVYNQHNWTAPVTVDLRGGTVSLIKQADRHFLMADNVLGVQIYSYEGRQVCSIKYPGLQPESLSSHTVSLSADTVAIRDRKDEKVIHIFDAVTGRVLGGAQPFRHRADVVSVALSCAPCSPDSRLLSIIDKNSDLSLVRARQSDAGGAVSLGSMVSSMCWNDSANILAAMQDSKFVIWYCPAVVFSDRELLPLTTVVKEGSEFLKSPQLLQFTGSHCSLRRTDGALITTSVSPFPSLLHQHLLSHKWDAAVRLCRFAKDPALWACLAGMAAIGKELATAEVAYAAISEVDKVQFIAHIRQLPSQERRSAELALFCHQPAQAEAIYLQAGLVYRAIDLNVSLFNWERALELALKHKTHVDTVLAFRDKYLEEVGCKETLAHFLQYSGKIAIDWEKIEAKVAAEEKEEASSMGNLT